MPRRKGTRPKSKAPPANEKAVRNAEIVRLCYEGVKGREIAARMGINLNRVYFIIKRETFRPD